MTGKDLKNSILQLAIQGKLVPQNPNEEPASELLARIRQEKERLVKEKKLKKKDLEITPITDEEKPFGIPESWEWCRLGELVENRAGLSYSKDNLSYQTNNMIRVLRGGNINYGSWTIKDDDVLISKEFVKDELLLKTGWFITPAVTSLENMAKTALIEYDCDNIVVGGFVLMLMPFWKQKSFLKYLLHYFRSAYYKEACKKITNKSGQAFYNISRSKLMEVIIPLPPLAEQQRIVAKIEELMPLVEEYDKNEQKLAALNKALPEQLRQSVLQQAIMGKLVPQDKNDEPASELLARIRKEKERLVKEKKLKKKDLETSPITDEEKPFEIPESWEWCRLNDVFTHSNGKQLNKGKSIGKMMDYITTSNLYWDKFVLDNLKQMPFEEKEIEKCQAIKGDLLVCEGGDVGRSNIWDKEYPIMLQNHIHKCRPYITLTIRYFYFLFRYFHSVGLINGKGIGLQGLSATVLGNIIIPLPPLAEQQRIVAKIEEIFSVIDNLKTC